MVYLHHTQYTFSRLLIGSSILAAFGSIRGGGGMRPVGA